MSSISRKKLYEWCRVPLHELEQHPQLKVPFRLVKDPSDLGRLMAQEIVDTIVDNDARGRTTRAIIPCGPNCWYEPFADIVNRQRISLKRLEVFHMDECLDWQGNELPLQHPYSFRGTMQRLFYDPIDPALRVELSNRNWLNGRNIDEIREKIACAPIDLTVGGWGQDGHVAYNQARRNPFSMVTLDELRKSSIRVQENNVDTVIALAQRSFGGAYQFVPPMSVTLGLRECFSAKKIRLYSDTGSWKQTALRIALFSEPTPEYPITLLQEHDDAVITATEETARHPLSEHPEWDFGFNGDAVKVPAYQE